MTKTLARKYHPSLTLYVGGAFGVVSAALMVYANFTSLSAATFAQMLLYLILPTLAALALGVMLIFRVPPLYTVIPVALGCLTYAMLEGYLMLALTSWNTFTMVWAYLDPASVICIAGATVCMLAGGAMYVLTAMGRLKKDIPVMIVLGLGILFLLAEYLVSMLQNAVAPSPWYMISAVLLLGAEIISVLCFEPVDTRAARPVPSAVEKEAASEAVPEADSEADSDLDADADAEPEPVLESEADDEPAGTAFPEALPENDTPDASGTVGDDASAPND